VRADLDLCVSALGAGASRRQRTRARWLPSSLWSQWSKPVRAGARGGTLWEGAGVDHAT
jgi:hypothetical protein